MFGFWLKNRMSLTVLRGLTYLLTHNISIPFVRNPAKLPDAKLLIISLCQWLYPSFWLSLQMSLHSLLFLLARQLQIDLLDAPVCLLMHFIRVSWIAKFNENKIVNAKP